MKLKLEDLRLGDILKSNGKLEPEIWEHLCIGYNDKYIFTINNGNNTWSMDIADLQYYDRLQIEEYSEDNIEESIEAIIGCHNDRFGEKIFILPFNDYFKGEDYYLGNGIVRMCVDWSRGKV